MLKINIVCIGSFKEKFWQEAEKEYLKRIIGFANIKIIELKEGNPSKTKEEILAYESLLIEKKLKGYIIICDKDGQQCSSEVFAKNLLKLQNTQSEITFVIGSSYGLDDKIKQKANLKLSFSSMTFAHNLFRIMLEEQIYRCFMINSNRKYHK